MFNRILGVLMLKAPVYREIAEDKTATQTAAILVVVVALIQGFCTGLVKTAADGTVSVSPVGGITNAVVSVVLGLIGWVVAAWLLAVIAKALDGKTDTGEMLRVTGFVQVFGLMGIFNLTALISPAITCVTSIIAIVVLVLSLIGYTIGVREAAEFSTGKAVITAVVAAVASFIIVNVIGGMIVSGVVGAMGLTGSAG